MNADLVRKENASRSVWKGKYPTRGPTLEDAAKMFGCLGAFVHQDGMRFQTGSIGSFQDTPVPLDWRQREGADSNGKAAEAWETGYVKVAELFGLTELVGNLEGLLRPLIESKKNTVVFPISVDAGVGLQILDSLHIRAAKLSAHTAKKINRMLGGVRCPFSLPRRCTTYLAYELVTEHLESHRCTISQSRDPRNPSSEWHK